MNYDADVYILDEASEFPDLVDNGPLGTDGEPKATFYDVNCLISYYLLISVAILLLIVSFIMFTKALMIKLD